MERHIAKAEALEARFALPILSMATSAPQIWPNQTPVVVGIVFDKFSQRSVASAEEVHDFIADRPWNFGDAF
jgi:hypothetical protein